MCRKIINTILFFAMLFPVKAQVDTVFTMARFDHSSLKIRWSCRNIDLLRAGLNEGWQLKLFREGQSSPLRVILVRSVPDAEIERALFTAADSSVAILFREIKSGGLFFDTQEQLEWYRFSFLFGLQDNFELSKKMGMAIEINDLDTSDIYRLEVEPVGGRDYIKSSYIARYQRLIDLPAAEQPHYVCSQNRVTFKGIMTRTAGVYSSYYLEKKAYNADSFVRINPLPLVVNYAYADPIIHFIDLIDSGGISAYRIHGKDMWGTFGPYSAIINVEPCQIQYLAPHPILIEENEDRGSLWLRWSIPDSLKHLLEGFQIFRAEQKFGDYQLINETLIAPEIFEYLDVNAPHLAYYQVRAIYQGQIERNSLTMMGSLLDVVPPAIPSNLRAVLDTTTMLVTISWDPVTDEDLKGYRISFSHGLQEPKFLLTNVEIRQTTFKDTLKRKSLHPEIYYWLTSRDFSQNESYYSSGALIKIPTMIPPVAPRITEVQKESHSIKIIFDRSASDDVQSHVLQRRKKNKSGLINQWEEVTLTKENWDQGYVDHNLALFDTIEYRIMARNIQGLTSVSNIRLGHLIESAMLPTFEYTRAELKDTIVIIYFDYPVKYRVVEFRLLGGINEEQMQTISVMPAENVLLQNGIKKMNSAEVYTLYRYTYKTNERNIRYFKIRAISQNGKVSPYSSAFTYKGC